MADPQRRRGEGHAAYQRRKKKVGAAERATGREQKEKTESYWRSRFEKDTGKKYGLATHGDYTSWLNEQRKKRKGRNMQEAGDALAGSK